FCKHSLQSASALTNQSSRSRAALKVGCGSVAPHWIIVHFIERGACHIAPRDLAALSGTGSWTCRRGPCGPAPTKFSPHRAVERAAPWRRVEKALFADDVNVSNSFRERCLWNIDSGSASVHLDVEGAYHLAPFLGFVSDELCEVGGRARQRLAEVSQTDLHLGVGEGRVDLLVELVDDFGRRGLRCAEAKPEARLIARHELAHGRDVRQRFRARRCGYCERTQPPSPDVFDHRGHGGERPLHLSTEQIGERGCCAPIR